MQSHVRTQHGVPQHDEQFDPIIGIG